MPQYFFDLRDGDILYQDLEGDELPDNEAARRSALLSARSSLVHQSMTVRKWLQLVYEVRNDQDQVVMIVRFTSAIDTEMSR